RCAIAPTRLTFRSPRHWRLRRGSHRAARSSPTWPTRWITTIRCLREWSLAMTDSASRSTTQLEPVAVPSGRRTRGRLRVPSSKSLTHRYLNLALLSGAPGVLSRLLFAEYPRLFLAALGRCGFQVAEEGDDVRLTPAERPAGEVEIFCG